MISSQSYKEGKVSIYDREVNFKMGGEGPAILVLHGWGGSSDSWVRVMEILIRKGCKVAVPDLPGFGQSDAPAAAWTVGDYVDWLNKFLLELQYKEKITGPLVILGHSFGGRVAVKLLSLQPEKATKLILCGPAGIKPEPDIQARVVRSLARFGDAIFGLGMFKGFKNIARRIFYFFLPRKDYARAKGVMRETMSKVLAEDLLPNLSAVKCKTLIVWGEADKIVPLKYAYIFKEKIKDSQLEILPRCGHSPHLEVPEKLAEITVKFLKD